MMADEVAFSQAGLRDIETVLRLMGDFYAGEHLAHTEECAAAATALCGEQYSGVIYLIHAGKIAAGYFVLTFGFSVERGGKIGLLDELYVAPALRGRGLGTAAVEEVVRVAQKAGCCEVVLEVDQGNERAARLYGRIGFRDLKRNTLSLPLVS
jgi:ribosomal protein S18 acetylase RimI-like enzyme